jgi:hypothetical protein
MVRSINSVLFLWPPTSIVHIAVFPLDEWRRQLQSESDTPA